MGLRRKWREARQFAQQRGQELLDSGVDPDLVESKVMAEAKERFGFSPLLANVIAQVIIALITRWLDKDDE